MMFRLHNLALPIEADEAALRRAAAAKLRLAPEKIRDLSIARRSLDARKKPVLSYIYTVDVAVAKDTRLSRGVLAHIEKTPDEGYRLPKSGREELPHRPVVVGSGPAGLFAAYLLAISGYRPLLLERGDDALTRTAKVQSFFETGKLDPSSNVQFGEGGAGTFSDGKLNTSVKDPGGRGRFVRETFVRFGADPAILYEQKPHLGTDVLTGILLKMRAEILANGGEVRFRSQVTGLCVESGRIAGVEVNPAAAVNGEIIPAEVVVLAPGHSARDTFRMLASLGVSMEAKAFAMGFRIEHPQAMIDLSQYGREDARSILGPAAYKLTHTANDGRGVYSFCMCPGGYVVNASSEVGGLCVNGMSYHDRDSANANSALLATVTPKDYMTCLQASLHVAGGAFGENTMVVTGEAFAANSLPEALAGVVFQQELERRAFQAAGGRVVQQLFSDFSANVPSSGAGSFASCLKGQGSFGDARSLLPAFLSADIAEGVQAFGRKIKGFDRPDAILSGIESRSSSPVRILRGETFEASLPGLYPAGEGAGYAGGIMSAAMDGLRVAEAIVRRFRPVIQ